MSVDKTGGVDGLLIEDNEIEVNRGMAIFVDADHNEEQRGYCRRVTIANNRTRGGGILLRGQPAERNRIVNNRHLGEEPAPIRNLAFPPKRAFATSD